ncbi:MAG: DUF47 family protein [Prevotellaceae bacterium]|jgi:uncharacterized protein Yka (UPF0111/DUF47 family)|nr:DUF47 family protein [Prevotellaceae bacterium]
MKLNSILSFFAPKDAVFISLLKDTAVVLVDAATLLERLFSTEDDDEQSKKLCALIKVEEVKGDKNTGKIFKALNKVFITPFDREDIHALADGMDDVIDAINRSSQKVLLYAPKMLPEYTLQLSSIVKQGAEEVQKAINELTAMRRNDQSIRIHCKEIKRLEEAADVVYEEGIISLFHGELGAVEIIKLKEIIQELEKSMNKINSVGKVLKVIIVKYA